MLFRSTSTGNFELTHPLACTLEALEATPETERDRFLLPVDSLLSHLPAVTVDQTEAQRLLQGQKLGLKRAAITGFARVYGPQLRFLGLVQIEPSGRTVPQRLLAQTCESP